MYEVPISSPPVRSSIVQVSGMLKLAWLSNLPKSLLSILKLQTILGNRDEQMSFQTLHFSFLMIDFPLFLSIASHCETFWSFLRVCQNEEECATKILAFLVIQPIEIGVSKEKEERKEKGERRKKGKRKESERKDKKSEKE